MGLRTKMLFGFTILTAMLFIAGVWSFYELRSMGSSVQKVLDENYRTVHAAKMMNEALERQDSGVLLLLLGRSEEGRATIRSGDEFFQKGFDVARNNIAIKGEQDYLDAIETKYKTYKNFLMKLAAGTEREADLPWYFQEVHKAFLNAKAAVTALTELNEKSMYQTASALNGRAHRAIMPGLVAILSALVFTLVFNYFVNLYVVTPIIKVTKGIRKFIETREPVDIEVEGKDELADLVSSVQDLIARLMR
jgi:methyl-accepting chemotaxis protein